MGDIQDISGQRDILSADIDTGDTRDLAKKAAVILKKGEGRTLKAGGFWVYDNEIAEKKGDAADGDILSVLDFDGYFLGRGFYNSRSKIRVRLLSRSEEETISNVKQKKRVRTAWEYRKHVIDTSSCRVIFGEADFLPGLTVDKYEDVLVVESLALGIDRLKEVVLKALVEVLAEDGIRIRGIYERSDAKVREKEGLPRAKGFLSAPFDTDVPITENGIHYLVDVKDGQKTGFFLDQKRNRMAVRPLCKDADVLDCFTHTGSFGLNAAAGGARHVLSVDASETAIARAGENAARNGFSGQVEYQVADVFALLPALEKEGRQFDVVILDPPAFTKSRSSVKAASRGYREINLRGMRLTKSGGYLATCSCSHFMTPELFEKAVREAARDAHVRLRQVECRTQAPDHPVLWGSSESAYLKFYTFQLFRD